MKIHILGGSSTKFGELWHKSDTELAREAINNALNDANLEPQHIDALFVGNMLSGALSCQTNVGSLFSGLLGRDIPSIRVEAACASGGMALHNGVNSILASQYQTVMVLGVEKMTDYSSDDITAALMSAGSREERLSGVTFPGIYALIAHAYMNKYGITKELLAGVAVKNHAHALENDKAQFQKKISVDDVMRSAKIADPLGLLDCSPVSDGASAVIISARAMHGGKTPVFITASEIATDTLSIHERSTLTSLSASVKASEKAYQKSGISPMDIDVAEVHDCFSIAEIIALEDLGFSQKGKAAYDIESGKYSLPKGRPVVNPSGGLKACGHPVGATGVKQVVEIAGQLRGGMSSRQVKNARVGLCHNIGGSGTIAVVHILQN